MSKVAKIVEFNLRTRVIVDSNASEEVIIQSAYPKIKDKIDNGELGDNLVEAYLDEECPFGTLDSDNPRVTMVILSTFDKKYLVVGKGIATQIIDFAEYSEWNSLKNEEGDYVLDCQIDFDDSVEFDNSDWYYQFQTVDLITDEEGNTSTGTDYRNAETFIVSHKPLTSAMVENLSLK